MTPCVYIVQSFTRPPFPPMSRLRYMRLISPKKIPAGKKVLMQDAQTHYGVPLYSTAVSLSKEERSWSGMVIMTICLEIQARLPGFSPGDDA